MTVIIINRAPYHTSGVHHVPGTVLKTLYIFSH